MNEQGRDTGFSIAWVFGGAVVMFGASFIGGFLAGMLDVRDVWAHAAIALICFWVGGFCIGKWSAGKTILEAGLAAVLAIVVALVIRGMSFPDDPFDILLGFGTPFLAALFGGWCGERAQG